MRRSPAEIRAAEDDLATFCPRGFADRYLRLEHAVDDVIDGEEKLPFGEALTLALGASIGSPALSIEEIESYAQDIAAMMVEVAMRHRNHRIAHGPWVMKENGAYRLNLGPAGDTA
jgi:hypothetical protein